MAPSFISSGHFNGPLYGSPAYHPQQGQDAQYLAFEQEARVASWPLPLVQPPHATQMPSISHTSHVHPPYATSSASRHQQVPLLDMSEVFHTQAMFHDLCGMELLYPDDDSLGTNEPAPPTALPGWNMQTHGFGFNNGYDAYSEVSFNGHASLMESARRQRVASGPEAGMSTPKTEQDLSGRYHCGPCNVYIDNNRRTRERHENTLKHCANVDTDRREPFQCKSCTASFAREDVLIRHQRARGH